MVEATQLGLLVRRSYRVRVLCYLGLARHEGATLLVGGDVPVLQGFEGGALVLPTCLTGHGSILGEGPLWDAGRGCL